MTILRKLHNWWDDVKGYELQTISKDAKNPGLDKWEVKVIK